MQRKLVGLHRVFYAICALTGQAAHHIIRLQEISGGVCHKVLCTLFIPAMRDTAERKWASGTLWERSMQRAELPCGALPFVYLTRDRREPPQQRGGFRIFGRRLEGALRTCKFPCTSANRTGLVGGGVLDAPSRKAAVFAKACLLPCRVLRDCHVGLRPPRNDKSVCLTPPNYRLNTCNCLGRSLSAATDAIGACHFNDSRYGSEARSRTRLSAPLQCTTGGLA